MIRKAKIKKIILPIIIGVLFGSFLLSSVAFALDVGLDYGTYTGLGTQDLRITIMRIVRAVLGFLGVVAIIIILYAGFVWMTAAGNAERVDKAKKILTNAIIGLVIILSAFGITSFVINQLLRATGVIGPEACSPVGITSSCDYLRSGCPGERHCEASGFWGGCQPTDLTDPDCSLVITSYPRIFLITNQICQATNTVIEANVTDPDSSGVNVTFSYVNNNTSASGNIGSVGVGVPATAQSPAWDTTGFLVNHSITVTARAVDPNSNTASDSRHYIIRAGHCCNDIRDDDEEGVDCGGADCSACTGAACDMADTDPNTCLLPADELCFSYYCDRDTCLCANKPIIYWLEPDNGAVGNLVTIYGNYFGDTPGEVWFTAASGEVLASLANSVNPVCDQVWTNKQIIVVVPSGAVNGPIKVVSGSYFDLTNDSYGPILSDFAVNSIVRPGLCRVINTATGEPQGKFEDPVELQGINFTANSKVYFSTLPAEGTINLSGTTKIDGVTVPNVQPAPDIGVRLQDLASSEFSNPIIFKVGPSGREPVIYRFTPASGAQGTYITIIGGNFGASRNPATDHVYLVGATSREASYDFPPECTTTYWSDGQIIVKVPADLANGSYTLKVENILGSDESADLFTVDSTTVRPNICLVTPDNGPIGQAINIYGENFYSPNVNQVNFYQDISQGDLTLDVINRPEPEVDTQIIQTTVPAGAITGPLTAQNILDKISNSYNFIVGECSVGSCSAGQECCLAGLYQGSCMPAGGCIGVPTQAAYFWSFNSFSPGPEVVNECNRKANCASVCALDRKLSCATDAQCVRGEQNFGPCIKAFSSPSPLYSRDGEVYINSVISASFTQKVRDDTLVSPNIKVSSCTGTYPDLDCGAEINGTIKIFTWNYGQVESEGFEFIPTNDLRPDTWYQAVITPGVIGENGLPLSSNFSWYFKTLNSSNYGDVGCISCQPAITTLLSQYDGNCQPGDFDCQNYLSSGWDQDNVCVVLNPKSYQWDWSLPGESTKRRASIFNNQPAVPNDTPIFSRLDTTEDITVYARAETTAIDPVKTKVEIDELGQEAYRYNENICNLQINFSTPVVTKRWPDCGAACSNALVGAAFSIPLNSNSITAPGSLVLYACANNLDCWPGYGLCNYSGAYCDLDLAGADCPHPADTSCLNSLYYDPTPIPLPQWVHRGDSVNGYNNSYLAAPNCYDLNGDGALDYCLLPNTYYRVILHNSITSAEGKPLGGLNYRDAVASDQVGTRDSYSWTFKTQSNLCLPSRSEVRPAENRLQVDDLDQYASYPYAASDICDPDGQPIIPASFTWEWRSSACEVADLLASSATGYLSYDFESGRCLAPNFNTLRNGCGNGMIGPGEDCDDKNIISGDGCSGTNSVAPCTKEGTLPCSSTLATNCCGNKILETGEECEQNSNLSWPAYCQHLIAGAGNCLWRGNNNDFSVCGNGAVEAGEDCDTGSEPNGNVRDGCTDNCLNTGSVVGISLCGDGQIGLGEECDGNELRSGGRPVSGDGCSDQCLSESDPDSGNTNYNQPICGNGRIEVGEECDYGGTCLNPLGNIVACTTGNALRVCASGMGACGNINSLYPDCTNNCLHAGARADGRSNQVAQALFEGETNIEAWPTVAREIIGQGHLTVGGGLTEGQFGVAEVWPDCSSACVNSDIGARFSKEINVTTLTHANIYFDECANSACSVIRQEVPFAISPHTMVLPGTDAFRLDLLPTYYQIDDITTLKPNTSYRVRITNGVISQEGEEIANLNFDNNGDGVDDSYAWIFTTQPSPVLCSLDSVNVIPQTAQLDEGGGRQNRQLYFAQPRSEPDQCNAQRLNPYSFDWRWDDVDLDSVDAVKFLLPLGNNSVPSLINHYDGCGNGKVEYGEDCDPNNPNLANPATCSLTCQWVGGGICGNDIIDSGEQCEDRINGTLCSKTGQRCEVANPATCAGGECYDYCSSLCIWQGNDFQGAVCGNGRVETGEMCDFGTEPNGADSDGCTNVCQYAGSPLISGIRSLCGDSRIEFGEECDNTSSCTNGSETYCSSYANQVNCLADTRCYWTGRECRARPCLLTNRDISVCKASEINFEGLAIDFNQSATNCHLDYSSVDLATLIGNSNWRRSVCGNGILESGEECDDRNIQDGDGCGATCLFSGSIFTDGRIDPFQVVESLNLSSLLSQVREEIQAWHNLRPERVGKGLLTVKSGSYVPFAVIGHQPPIDSDNQCRNVAVWAIFSQELNLETLTPENFILDYCQDSVCSDNPTAAVNIITGLAYTSVQGKCNSNSQCEYMVSPTTNFVFESSSCESDANCRGSKVTVTSIAGSGFFERNSLYKLFIRDGEGGILSQETIDNTLQCSSDNLCAWNFSTSDDFCECDYVGVTIDPTSGGTETIKDLFTCAGDNCGSNTDSPLDNDVDSNQAGNQHRYSAQCYDINNLEGFRIPVGLGVEYGWVDNDFDSIIYLTDPELDSINQNYYVTPEDKNGRAYVNVVGEAILGPAVDALRSTASQQVEVTNFICDNPWPDISRFQDSSTNFELLYCQDFGQAGFADDLPSLPSLGATIAAQPQANILKEFIFPVCNSQDECSSSADFSKDAIGIRVMKNLLNLSPAIWYRTGLCRLAESGQRESFENLCFKDSDCPAVKYCDENANGVIEQNEATNCQDNSGCGPNLRCLPAVNNCVMNVPLQGGPQSVVVDGYEAVRDGRTVYVGATNLASPHLFSNIYLISSNQGAQNPTVEIFNRILDQTQQTGIWYFNANTSNQRICNQYGYFYQTNILCSLEDQFQYTAVCDSYTPIKYCGGDLNERIECEGDSDCNGRQCMHVGDIICNEHAGNFEGCFWSDELNACLARPCGPIYCRNDFECPNLNCNADKEKLVRDAKRFGNLRDIQITLKNYFKRTSKFPELSSGTYITTNSFSLWPSWSQTLGQALGGSLYTDPINKFVGCADFFCDANSDGRIDASSETTACTLGEIAACSYNPKICQPLDPDQTRTCWDELSLQFYCPQGMFNYAYSFDQDQSNYKLYTNFEYQQEGSWATRPAANATPGSEESKLYQLPRSSVAEDQECRRLNFEIHEAVIGGGSAAINCQDRGGDGDADGICDDSDNCATSQCSNPSDCYNPNQRDSNTNGLGDVCDPGCSGDADSDGICDEADNCRTVYNPDQRDSDGGDDDGNGIGDGDGIGDACDPCTDLDSDGWWDVATAANDPNICPKDNCPAGVAVLPDHFGYCRDANNNPIPNQPCCLATGQYGLGVCDTKPGCDSCNGRDFGSYNPLQEDYDNDQVGYICDSCLDFDNDGLGDYTFYTKENKNRILPEVSWKQHFSSCQPVAPWPEIINLPNFILARYDIDYDGKVDLDNCPAGPYAAKCYDEFGIEISCYNPGQEDENSNLWGDVCDWPPTSCNVSCTPTTAGGLGCANNLICFDSNKQGDFRCRQQPCVLDASCSQSTRDDDGDGVLDCTDNCPNTKNPYMIDSDDDGTLDTQWDSDGDGIGDLCDDCYNYNDKCLELTITQEETYCDSNDNGTIDSGENQRCQGNINCSSGIECKAKLTWQRNFLPYAVAQSPKEFYCYTHGGEIVTSECSNPIEQNPDELNPASANIVYFDIAAEDRSEIFAYLNTASATPMLGLGFLHDIPTSAEGGEVYFKFGGNAWKKIEEDGSAIIPPTTPATIAVSDDTNASNHYGICPIPDALELDTLAHRAKLSCKYTDLQGNKFQGSDLQGFWTWAPQHTDGGMIQIAPLTESWCLTVTPKGMCQTAYLRCVPCPPDDPLCQSNCPDEGDVCRSFHGIDNWVVKVPGPQNVVIPIPSKYYAVKICYNFVPSSTTVTYYCDEDSDGYISQVISGSCTGTDCQPDGCLTSPGNDCDDNNANVNLSRTENTDLLCADGVDNDCDSYTNCNDFGCAGKNGPNGFNCCWDGNYNPDQDRNYCDTCQRCRTPLDLGLSGNDYQCRSADSAEGVNCEGFCTYCLATGSGSCEARADGDSTECPTNQACKNGTCQSIFIPPSCSDSDSDGYGNPGDASCLQGAAIDCNDANSNIYPNNTNLYCNCNNTDGFTQQTNDSSCDGIDNDCNGLKDEDYVATPTSCGIGVCASTGSMACDGGQLRDTCTPSSPLLPSDTLCNGLDDDCDGQVDENYEAVAITCDIGACRRDGWRVCQGGSTSAECIPGTPSPEVCDGIIDNDCDGSVDEGCECSAGSTRPCSNQQGVCLGSPETCDSSGHWPGCNYSTIPNYHSSEAGFCLDNLDNDCDRYEDCQDTSDCPANAVCSGNCVTAACSTSEPFVWQCFADSASCETAACRVCQGSGNTFNCQGQTSGADVIGVAQCHDNVGCTTAPCECEAGSCQTTAADIDKDEDGVADNADSCPYDPDNDFDEDGLCAVGCSSGSGSSRSGSKTNGWLCGTGSSLVFDTCQDGIISSCSSSNSCLTIFGAEDYFNIYINGKFLTGNLFLPQHESYNPPAQLIANVYFKINSYFATGQRNIIAFEAFDTDPDFAGTGSHRELRGAFANYNGTGLCPSTLLPTPNRTDPVFGGVVANDLPLKCYQVESASGEPPVDASGKSWYQVGYDDSNLSIWSDSRLGTSKYGSTIDGKLWDINYNWPYAVWGNYRVGYTESHIFCRFEFNFP